MYMKSLINSSWNYILIIIFLLFQKNTTKITFKENKPSWKLMSFSGQKLIKTNKCNIQLHISRYELWWNEVMKDYEYDYLWWKKVIECKTINIAMKKKLKLFLGH